MQLHISLLLLLVSTQSTLCGLTRREASPDPLPEADPEADPGLVAPAPVGPVPPPQQFVSEPVCRSVPQRHCKPRQIENPREECHTETDTIVDTIVTEHCEEVITTQCTQTSQTSRSHSAVVGQDSQVVSTGVSPHPGVAVAPVAVAHGAVAPVVAGAVAVGAAHGAVAPVAHAHGHIGKREADPEAAPDAEADPEADPHGYTPGPTHVQQPVCATHPVRQCKKVPEQRPRQVSRVVCKTVADITIIEDCRDVVTTQCQQQSRKVVHTSAVVGQDTRLVQGPRVVAAGHTGVGHPVQAGPVVGHAVAGAPTVGHAGPFIGPARAPVVAGAAHAIHG